LNRCIPSLSLRHQNLAAVFTDPQSISMHVVTAILPLHL
jgi:hypothetical protein